MEVKMKYKDLGSMEFVTAIQKIANTPTAAAKASVIRGVINAVQKAKEEIAANYRKNVMEVFGQKNEDGSLKTPEGEPNSFVPDETKMDDLAKANLSFGDNEATISLEPPLRQLNPLILSDVKITAKELDLLKDLFVEESGPGVPTMAPQMQPRSSQLTQ